MQIKGFTLLYPMSRRSNGHPIGVHISYCHDVNNLCIKPLFTIKHEKVSLHQLYPSQQVQDSPHKLAGFFKYVLLYMSEENTTGTVLYLLCGSVKESDYVCHPNESLTRESSVYLWPVTGCRYWARARIYMTSHKFNTPLVKSVVSAISMLLFFFVFFACSAIRFVC